MLFIILKGNITGVQLDIVSLFNPDSKFLNSTVSNCLHPVFWQIRYDLTSGGKRKIRHLVNIFIAVVYNREMIKIGSMSIGYAFDVGFIVHAKHIRKIDKKPVPDAFPELMRKRVNPF